jgi:hypothetical protein
MSNFNDWLFSKVLQEAGEEQVAGDFQQAKQEIESLIDQKFQEIVQRLQTSFGSTSKIDQNTRERMAQTLLAMAKRLRLPSSGSEPTSPPKPVMDHIEQVADKMHEVETADPASYKIMGVGEYLRQSKSEIMKGIDGIFHGLQQNMINKGLSDLGGKLDSLHQKISQPPMNNTEKDNAYHALADLGRAISMRKRKGLQDKINSDVKIFAGPRSVLTFNPSDPMSINQALMKIENPRHVRVIIDGKPFITNLTDESDVSKLMSVINSRTQLPEPTPTPEMDPLKQARKPREKGGQPNIKIDNRERLPDMDDKSLGM